MQQLDVEIYITVIQAAGRVVESSNCTLDDKIEALPKSFKAMMDAVQLHKEECTKKMQPDNQHLN